MWSGTTAVRGSASAPLCWIISILKVIADGLLISRRRAERWQEKLPPIFGIPRKRKVSEMALGRWMSMSYRLQRDLTRGRGDGSMYPLHPVQSAEPPAEDDVQRL
ncbi:unnamed protein product [Boreogadus saida]